MKNKNEFNTELLIFVEKIHEDLRTGFIAQDSIAAERNRGNLERRGLRLIESIRKEKEIK